MLRREEAQKRLESFRIKNWDRKRQASLDKQPAKLAEIGRALLKSDYRDAQERQKTQMDAAAGLEKLSSGERSKVFAALHPTLGKHFTKAWDLMAGLPYQSSYQRKAFRTPKDPAPVRQARLKRLVPLIQVLGPYEQDAAWVAAWAGYLSSGDALGLLLAAVIDGGGAEGEQVFDILRESASNQHEIGIMGRHVSRALLVASRPDGWEFMEKMLLAAQRQEGLRQVILESVDEAHPEAFRRMMRLVLEHNLLRFSAAVRAVDVWFGLGWDSLTPRAVQRCLEQVVHFLEDSAARDEALTKESGETLYLALWTLGFADAIAAVPRAAALLHDAQVERRYVAAHFLSQLELPQAREAVAAALDDEDLRVALRALEGCATRTYSAENQTPVEVHPDIFDALTRLVPRLPERPAVLPAIVWPWTGRTAVRHNAADQLVGHLGTRPPTVLLPYLPQMSPWPRRRMIGLLGQQKWDDQVRDTFFALAGDPNSYVSEAALGALDKRFGLILSEAEAARLEGYLSRKKANLRRGVLTLLLKQKSPDALASADRLLAAKKPLLRLGGLELLRQLIDTKGPIAWEKKWVTESRKRADAYRESHPRLGEEEQVQIDAILNIERVVPKIDDAFGLMDPSQRTPRTPPRKLDVTFLTPAAIACLESLDELIHQHRETTVSITTYQGRQDELLGNLNNYRFPAPSSREPLARDVARLPLREVWEKWLEGRPRGQRDRDGLELVRALAWSPIDPAQWAANLKKDTAWRPYRKVLVGACKLPEVRRRFAVGVVLRWLLRLHPPAGAADFLLDALEASFARVPPRLLRQALNMDNWQERQKDWRFNSPINWWTLAADTHRQLCPQEWSSEHGVRHWRLFHWRDQPAPGVGRMLPELDDVLAAYQASAATDADVLERVIAAKDSRQLDRLTALDPHPAVKASAGLQTLLDRCRQRILDIELARGELPTAASGTALHLRSLFGLDTLLRLLAAIGDKPFSRKSWYYGEGGLVRVNVLTHLTRYTYPTAEDTPETFATAVKRAGLSRERLLELAFLAPQWLPHVEHAVGWEGLREGVWWFLAHMSGGHHGLGGLSEDAFFRHAPTRRPERRVEQKGNAWDRLISERTPLTASQRLEGGVDTAWFTRVHETLGPRRWQALTQASKYGASGQSHKKAALIADVLLGKARKSDLVRGIRERQLRESVRLLGLLPLAKGERRDADLLARYRILTSYRRYVKGLSPMSRESAQRTYEIGIDNLARTAGYPDPVRLEWAMEAREIADLAAGPISVSRDGVTVTLSLDENAQPQMTIQRGERTLQSIPPQVRKHPKVAALVERRADLKRQASRMRESLEKAMCRGDTFTGAELRQLFAHPILAPYLERLVLLGEGISGFPVHDGKALRHHSGKVEPIKPAEQLRLAHPHDLLISKQWPAWQKLCFATETIQPFKQVFRELYVVTEQEKADGAISHRYAGQQVNPSQAMALFGSRGWATQDGVSKTFHDLGLIAEVMFRSGAWTPLEMEGLTLDGVYFRPREDYKPLPLEHVPPRVFSEVMRDVDLVVSVAHLGGVDPEASASTVEMRAALLRETCQLLQIRNYRMEKVHVLIDGKLGTYSVHLGSGVVHRQPGGALCIVPVHAQHRGRLFLPFADDDPRTAEVLSKVLLLARDHEIQDPSILSQ